MSVTSHHHLHNYQLRHSSPFNPLLILKAIASAGEVAMAIANRFPLLIYK
ncbi:MAG: hypothetical protein AB4426_31685 [Xenococcaceae cyanobacterium]